MPQSNLLFQTPSNSICLHIHYIEVARVSHACATQTKESILHAGLLQTVYDGQQIKLSNIM